MPGVQEASLPLLIVELLREVWAFAPEPKLAQRRESPPPLAAPAAPARQTVPPAAAFAKLLQQPEAEGLLDRLKRFVAHVDSSSLAGEALVAAVRAFYWEMEERLAEHPLFHNATEVEMGRARDDIELFVMARLYARALVPSAADQLVERELCARRRALSKLLIPERLGMSAIYTRGSPWPQAQAELFQMERHRAPRDKLLCILKCCTSISASLTDSACAHARAAIAAPSADATAAADGGADAAAHPGAHGADELFPALVCVMAHCELRAPWSTLAYAAAYRHPARLEAEGELHYYLTHALSALEFVRTCTARQLVGVSQRAFADALSVGLRAAAAEERAKEEASQAAGIRVEHNAAALGDDRRHAP